MKQAFIQVRLSHGEKSSIQKAAEYFGESVSEFIRRGALLRLKQGKSETDSDPFLQALNELTQGKASEAIPTDVATRLKASRSQGQGNQKWITAGDAVRLVAKEIDKLKKKI